MANLNKYFSQDDFYKLRIILSSQPRSERLAKLTSVELN